MKRLVLLFALLDASQGFTQHPKLVPRSRHQLYRKSFSSHASSRSNLIPPAPTDRWTRWITGTNTPQRPSWAKDWMPTWLVRLRPSLQLVTVVVCYFFHMTVLAQHSLSFPIQLIPNDRGHFQDIGLDS